DEVLLGDGAVERPGPAGGPGPHPALVVLVGTAARGPRAGDLAHAPHPADEAVDGPVGDVARQAPADAVGRPHVVDPGRHPRPSPTVAELEAQPAVGPEVGDETRARARAVEAGDLVPPQAVDPQDEG